VSLKLDLELALPREQGFKESKHAPLRQKGNPRQCVQEEHRVAVLENKESTG
jgi:hypothetical protein